MNKIEEFKKELENTKFQILYDNDWKAVNAEDVLHITYGQLIAHHLFKVIETSSSKYICANQIGLPYKVVVLNIREPLYLINPEILDEKFPMQYIESDVSYPNKIAETNRFGMVLVSAMNLKSPIWFGVKSHQGHLLEDKVALTHPVIQEAVAIQHCIDTLNNISMFERNVAYTYKKLKKPNRNELISVYKGEQELKIKYKKLNLFLNQGWNERK